jgi:hypothetical protein
LWIIKINYRKKRYRNILSVNWVKLSGNEPCQRLAKGNIKTKYIFDRIMDTRK